ncbi:MAG: hypothetical protein AAF680_13410 [Pseudomonadota bacterium]
MSGLTAVYQVNQSDDVFADVTTRPPDVKAPIGLSRCGADPGRQRIYYR